VTGYAPISHTLTVQQSIALLPLPVCCRSRGDRTAAFGAIKIGLIAMLCLKLSGTLDDVFISARCSFELAVLESFWGKMHLRCDGVKKLFRGLTSETAKSKMQFMLLIGSKNYVVRMQLAVL